MFRQFTDLDVGFSNAENYRKRQNKELFQKYFVRDEYLDRLLNPNVYFLVGEKGTGKTAYTVFLSNNEYKNHKASTFDVRQTEYQKFLELKRQGHLNLSTYSEIWRTLLLIATATTLLASSDAPEILRRFTKLAKLKSAIDEFYENAFAPEIVKMINFVESSELSTSIMAKHALLQAEFSPKSKHEVKDSNSVFQTNLLKIRKAFEAAIGSVKISTNTLIFIDGIDVRPSNISYSDYFDCVRGLIDAVWEINSTFFANIKDSPGQIRVVLLVRPDIFIRTGLHNINTKLKDNSVFLNWSTTYRDYRSSLLFKIADRLLSVQQEESPKNIGDAWDYYFPFHAENVKSLAVSGQSGVNSFLSFLRFSYYRPRDINSMISTIKEFVKKNRGAASYVTAEDFSDPSFRDAHADYLLGEIRDQLLFYYSQDEYDLFLQFFSHLRGKRKFTHAEYIEAFNEFISECNGAGLTLPQFFDSADKFLQFIYEQNVICYKEKEESKSSDSEAFIRWCFRERTLSNMSPKVRNGVTYEIFYGLSKALNVGRPIHVDSHKSRSLVGSIIKLNSSEGFGFIRGGAQHDEYYFKIADFSSKHDTAPRVGQKVIFIPQVKTGKLRATSIRPAPSKLKK
jgi:cold shock CspA family protein